MNKINYFFLLSLLVISPTIYAKTIPIDFTPYDTYSIEVAHIDVGDTIEWLPNIDHNVEFLGGPNMDSLPEKSGFNSFYKLVYSFVKFPNNSSFGNIFFCKKTSSVGRGFFNNK